MEKNNKITDNKNLSIDNIKNTKNKNILIKNQIIKIIIWIIWLTIAINIMNPLIENHWFNWLMIIIYPWLWWVIVWPILIINSIYNIIFYFLIKKFKNSKNKILIIKNIIWLLTFSIIPLFYFIWWIKLMNSNNLFSSIYDFPFISWLLLLIILYHLRKNYLNYKNIKHGKKDFNTKML